MNKPGGRSLLRWSAASVRLRLLGGLAALLIVGMAGSSIASALLLGDFLHQRFISTLQTDADRARSVLSTGPQTANADQLSALLGPPLGIDAIDSAGHVLTSTGTAAVAPRALAAAAASAPAGRVVYYRLTAGYELAAIRIPSPGLTIDQGAGYPTVRPAALIICIDTSIDDATINSLIFRLASILVGTLVLLLGIAVFVLRLGMKPLTRLAHTADAIAAGSLAQRLPTRGDGSETDQLAEAVNNAFDAQARAEATVRSFVADASHELRTPLSVISGWLDLRRQGGLDGPDLQAALEHIDHEVGRMRLLVEELGLLARLDAGRPVEQDDVDLTALAASVVEDAQVIYPDRGVTLTAKGPAPVLGDAARLQQVLRNLVGNAVQHTPDHCSVVVEIAVDAEHTELRVIDNGPGIAAEELPRVFDRFWRAEASRSRAYGGSGLGLAIVQAIIHAHHGSVAVHSTVGVGTTVTVRLPRP